MKSIIQKSLLTIDKDQSISDAIEIMEKENVSRLLVTDGGVVIGILTEEDIARRLGTGRERKLKSGRIHVSAAMTKKLVVVSSQSEPKEAATIMLKHGFSSLPIVENNEVLGIVTKTDLIKIVLKSNKKVNEFYTRNPFLVNPGDTLIHAYKLMLEKKIHRLLVSDKGILVGIITERDIARGLETFRKALDKDHHPKIKGLCVEHVMTRDPIKITTETTVGEAAAIMLEREISGLPVIAKELGILTKTDIVRGIAEGKLP